MDEGRETRTKHNHGTKHGRGWTPRDELHDLANRSIDPNLSLYEAIGSHEASTFDPKNKRVMG
jgi:hypothetical protein